MGGMRRKTTYVCVLMWAVILGSLSGLTVFYFAVAGGLGAPRVADLVMTGLMWVLSCGFGLYATVRLRRAARRADAAIDIAGRRFANQIDAARQDWS